MEACENDRPREDALERIAALIDVGQFRPDLEQAAPRSDGSKGGRPAFDQVLMFKVLLLQTMHTLCDERCEYLIEHKRSLEGPGARRRSAATSCPQKSATHPCLTDLRGKRACALL